MRRYTVARLGAGIAMVMACTCIFLLATVNAQCQSPTFIGEYYGPERILSEVIQKNGGLPKADTEITIEMGTWEAVDVYPITDWRVAPPQVTSVTSILANLLDDDPTYSISANVNVQYADGSEGVLRWRSWRYGSALCPVLPVVIGRGDGPPGEIQVLRLSN